MGELADALLFGGEADSYELTRIDWIHRFNLEEYFLPAQKRPPADVADVQVKKKSRGYFKDESSDAEKLNIEKPDARIPQHQGAMWEYKGNKDGAMHGPYTSRQMLDWKSYGYFMGDSAVDVRRLVKCGSRRVSAKQKGDNESKTNMKELMADLMHEEKEDAQKQPEEENTETLSNSSWMRSDMVDFSLYL